MFPDVRGWKAQNEPVPEGHELLEYCKNLLEGEQVVRFGILNEAFRRGEYDFL